MSATLKSLKQLRAKDIEAFENKIKHLKITPKIAQKIIDIEIDAMIEEIHKTIIEGHWENNCYWLFDEAEESLNEFIKDVLRIDNLEYVASDIWCLYDERY